MTVQPTGVDNLSSSAILDLPNVNTNLPPSFLPNPSPHHHHHHHNQVHQVEVNNPGQVANSEILKSIQSITEVMQQQLLLNSKTTEQGIVQTASLFQEMIKAQEKRDLDPALLAIPTFSGEAKDRPQCLDWVSRVKNICDQSGHSFRQELINKSGILVQNFIRSLNENITNNELTEKILQFFSDVPTTSHALNKLQLIQQGAEEPIVNYNQCYQNLVERVKGCQLNSIRSTVAMELYLGSIIGPIRKSIRNTLYFNSKHAPKTLGETMQKAQDLHIKHLYAIGEDQELVASSSDVLPEITINEVTSREDRGWYKNKRDFREHLQNSREVSLQRREYTKRVTFNQSSGTRTANNSEYSNSSQNSWVPKEPENDKSVQQPSVIRGSFTQIMVNPMQLEDHEFTAWLDRLVEARKNQQERRQRPYRNFRKPYNDGRQNAEGSKPPLRNRIKPAQELEVQQIMDNFNCEYDDVVEAVDLYNLDVEECTTALLPHGYEPDNYFISNEPPKEICIVEEFQRCGMTFPKNIETRHKKLQFFTLMDTGAMRSCINYNTFHKLNAQLTQREVLKVIGADGGDLGSMGTVQLMLSIGTIKVTQDFIVCRELRRNIILGVDFAKQNCAGIQWVTNRTRVLLLNGIKAVKVEEDELGIPVTASYHVKVPPRHNSVFKVNIHAEIQGMQVIMGNKHLLEKHLNMYQHKIAILAAENSERFPLLAITNLDHINFYIWLKEK